MLLYLFILVAVALVKLYSKHWFNVESLLRCGIFKLYVRYSIAFHLNICIKNITIDVAISIIRLGAKNILKNNDCEFDYVNLTVGIGFKSENEKKILLCAPSVQDHCRTAGRTMYRGGYNNVQYCFDLLNCIALESRTVLAEGCEWLDGTCAYGIIIYI